MKSVIRTTAVGFSAILMVALSQCGGGPEQARQPLAITTASLPNGTAWVVYSQTIRTTGGVGPFTWSVKSGALPHNLALSSSTSSVETVSGTPDSAVQTLAFTIQVTDSAGHTATQSYKVSILLEPDTLVASPASLSFGMQLNGTASVGQTLTLTNNGSDPLAIVNVATDAPDFTATSTCGSSIAAGARCMISVTFTPTAVGPRSSTLTIADNSAGSPHSYSLDGMGLTQGPNVTFSSGTSYTFSSRPGVPSLPQSVNVSNFGTATLDITSVATSPGFSETDNCVGSIAPGNFCLILVTFTTTTTGTVRGTLAVNDNAPGSPQSVSLIGNGAPGMCTQKGGICSNSQQCCAGLACVFTGGILRPAWKCE